MLITAPLSTVAGMLAELNRAWPFLLNLGLTIIAALVTLRLWRLGLGEEVEG